MQKGSDTSRVIVPRPRHVALRRLAPVIAPCVAFLVIGGAEECLSRTLLINPSKFPPVTQVFGALIQETLSGAIWTPVGQTLLTWLVSLALSFVAAVMLGTVLGLSQTLYALAAPIVE